MLNTTKFLNKVLQNRTIPFFRHTGSISTAVFAPQNRYDNSRTVHTVLDWKTKSVVTQSSNVNKVTGALLISYFSTNMAANPIATYEEIKDLPNHPEKLLIDVREPSELRLTGKIPTSINIPLANVTDELKLGADEFKKKYSRAKPGNDTEVIFSCLKGGRAQKAADAAKVLGFVNARNYLGSWTEYATKEGLPI